MCASQVLPPVVEQARTEGRLLSPAEVARSLGISRSRLYKLRYDGWLDAVKVGGQLRYHPDAIVAFLERSERGESG